MEPASVQVVGNTVEQILLNYAPLIGAVLIFLFNMKFFVRPEDMEKRLATLTDERREEIQKVHRELVKEMTDSNQKIMQAISDLNISLEKKHREIVTDTKVDIDSAKEKFVTYTAFDRRTEEIQNVLCGMTKEISTLKTISIQVAAKQGIEVRNL